MLIISNRRSILMSNINETSVERLPISVENVVATISDTATDTLYWSDMKVKKIMRLEKGGQPQEVSAAWEEGGGGQLLGLSVIREGIDSTHVSGTDCM